MLTAHENTHAEQWQRVRDAISERWPELDRGELARCENCVDELTSFVKQRVGAEAQEVAAVVSEFAPQESIVERVSHVASDSLQHASESAQFAYMRADECIAKRPTESVLTSFAAGIILGAAVTALWMRSTTPPSTWDRVRSRSWS